MNDVTFVTTADGSATLFSERAGEHYHSKHGALQESRHVFVTSGLNYFLDQHPVKEVSILEVGFGTGLNFLLTADLCTQQHISLRYTGIEAFPLPEDIIFRTGYDQYVLPATWEGFRRHYTSFLSAPVKMDPYVACRVAETELMSFQDDHFHDILYFDAFAAVHQPEMWTYESLQHCTSFLKQGGVFVTYAITGNLKRVMKSLNFSIEKAPGAPGKREMLRAVKLS